MKTLLRILKTLAKWVWVRVMGGRGRGLAFHTHGLPLAHPTDEIRKDLQKALEEQKKEVTKSINKTIQGVKDDLVKEMVVIKQEIAGVRALAAKAHTSPIEPKTIFPMVSNRSVLVSCLMVPQLLHVSPIDHPDSSNTSLWSYSSSSYSSLSFTPLILQPDSSLLHDLIILLLFFSRIIIYPIT